MATEESTKTTLSPRDLCSILKACGDARVTLLQLGDLHVEFAGPASPAPVVEIRTDTLDSKSLRKFMNQASQPISPPGLAETQARIAEEALVDDELALREQQIAELHLTNPLLAEQLITQGELEDHGSIEHDEEA
jgi:hypothetical protein